MQKGLGSVILLQIFTFASSFCIKTCLLFFDERDKSSSSCCSFLFKCEYETFKLNFVHLWFYERNMVKRANFNNNKKQTFNFRLYKYFSL